MNGKKILTLSLSIILIPTLLALAADYFVRVYITPSDLNNEKIQERRVDFNSLKLVSDAGGQYVFESTKKELVTLIDPPPQEFLKKTYVKK